MGREAGPTISVSTSGMNITGTAEDLLSGTVGYCYNQSDTPDEFTSVEPVQTASYTAPQFKITASGVWRFHAKDLAGNSDFKSTSSLTKLTYHCNYCNQDTNSLHFNCPMHFSSRSCSLSGGTCDLMLGYNPCRKTPCYTGVTGSQITYTSTQVCPACGRQVQKGDIGYGVNEACGDHMYAPRFFGGPVVCQNCTGVGHALRYIYQNRAAVLAPEKFECEFNLARQLRQCSRYIYDRELVLLLRPFHDSF